MPALEPVAHVLVRDRVYDALSEAILDGTLEPGRKLVIDDLARSLGASQMPVREAMQRLVHEGLVERTSRSSHRVTVIDEAEARALLEAQAVLLTAIYRRSLPRLSPADIAGLRTTLDRATQADDLQETRRVIVGFWDAIAEKCDNPVLLELRETIRRRLVRAVRQVWQTQSSEFGEAVNEAVLERLEVGDPEGALMRYEAAWREFLGRIGSSTASDGEDAIVPVT